MTDLTLDTCAVSLAAWLYLVIGRGFFWLARERNLEGISEPSLWPAVTAVVPARNEADVIERTIGSLLRQEYPGPFRIVLVDDQSTDDTGDLARSLGSERLEVIAAAERPDGWTGKLWAVAQGVAYANAHEPPSYLWLTDADIVHSGLNLRTLVARAEAGEFVLVSEMAKLHCRTFSEKLLVPAFVYFFDMLYPFAWVNDPRNTMAAAAGGSMLVRGDALDAAGGIEAIRREIIDDCALARLMKNQGPIWLGLTDLAQSVRPYTSLREVGAMISRSAYAQLHYSVLMLAGTVLGMALLFVVPALATFALPQPAGILGLLTWTIMAASFQPMLRFYRLSSLWGFAFPLIGLIYTFFTFESAVQFWQGRGGMWKGRAQAMRGV